MDHTNQTKIVVPLEEDHWSGAVAETMWAERVAAATYRLMNVPALAYGLSLDDVVRAPLHEGRPTFANLVQSSGRSTYRIFLTTFALTSPRFAEFWTPLQHLGCTYEGSAHLLAVDVPQEASIHDVYRLLDAGENAGVWEFDEGKCAHPTDG
jgi:hypothetical protein